LWKVADMLAGLHKIDLEVESGHDIPTGDRNVLPPSYHTAAREHGEGKKTLNSNSIEAAEEAATEAEAEHTLVHGMGAEPKPRQASGFHGVTFTANKKRWAAMIKYGDKTHYIGTFDTKQEAALAYDMAARGHGGGKKKLNYESVKAAEEAAAEAEAEHTLVHGMGAEPKKPRQSYVRAPSGFHGVCATGKRWVARIRYGGKNHRFGTFDTKQEAALAYDRAAREHGEGKNKLNYDSIEAAEEAAAEAEAEHTLVHGMGAEPKKPRQASGFHGVTADGKRWKAQIRYGGKNYHIGTFNTKQEAALAYDRATREHGGGKNKLNYESIEAAEEAAAEAEAEHTLVHGMGAEPKKPRQASGFHGGEQAMGTSGTSNTCSNAVKAQPSAQYTTNEKTVHAESRAGQPNAALHGYERRAWTRKEDEAIIRLVGTYGTKRWSEISKNLNKEEIGMKRTGKQCRTRCTDHFAFFPVCFLLANSGVLIK
jgi:hypothetical protein